MQKRKIPKCEIKDKGIICCKHEYKNKTIVFV